MVFKPVRLSLSKSLVKKLSLGQGVRLSRSHLEDGEHTIAVKHHKHKKLINRKDAAKGIVLRLDQEEIEHPYNDDLFQDAWGKSELIEGGFLDSWKRTPGLLPPSSRKVLDSMHNMLITSMIVARAPIPGEAAYNALTLGAYNKALQEMDYDHMYHLGLELNNKYTFHKNEVVNLEQGRSYEETNHN
jgi:hypothetical protein